MFLKVLTVRFEFLKIRIYYYEFFIFENESFIYG